VTLVRVTKKLIEEERVAGGPLDAPLGEGGVRRKERLGEACASSGGNGPSWMVVNDALAASARHASSSGSPSTRDVMTSRAGRCDTAVVSLARCAKVA
jgi:hypothetical protein